MGWVNMPSQKKPNNKMGDWIKFIILIVVGFLVTMGILMLLGLW